MRTAAISAHVSRSDVVLVSDYGRGITSDPMLRLTLRSTNVPVIWDPHPKGSHPVRGAYIVTPNLAEASLHSQEEGPLRKAMALQAQWHADCVVVTAGAHGVHVSAAPLTAHIPTTPLAGLDTCGAGDRFASALAGEVPEGHDLMTALRRATQRATEFVAAGAAATVSIMKDVRVQEHNVPFTKAGGV